MRKQCPCLHCHDISHTASTPCHSTNFPCVGTGGSGGSISLRTAVRYVTFLPPLPPDVPCPSCLDLHCPMTLSLRSSHPSVKPPPFLPFAFLLMSATPSGSIVVENVRAVERRGLSPLRSVGCTGLHRPPAARCPTSPYAACSCSVFYILLLPTHSTTSGLRRPVFAMTHAVTVTRVPVLQTEFKQSIDKRIEINRVQRSRTEPEDP
ncbi:hypothetical protein BC826DRAFT_993670 [Russula brevipes]|nr:hypothetical protein BC826DRAFT_993670 [Russula brevipes]